MKDVLFFKLFSNYYPFCSTSHFFSSPAKKWGSQTREGRDVQVGSQSRLAFISRAGHIVHIARRGRAFAKNAFGTKSASSTKAFLCGGSEKKGVE